MINLSDMTTVFTNEIIHVEIILIIVIFGLVSPGYKNGLHGQKIVPKNVSQF